MLSLLYPAAREIRLKARRRGAEMEISVSDSGIGIPADGRERLFRPFEQGDGSPAFDSHGADTSGTGLGLSIARNLIHLHGGTLDLRSQPGRRTTVSCLLPAGNERGLSTPLAQPEPQLEPDLGPNGNAQPRAKKKQKNDIQVLLNDADADEFLD